MADYTELKKRLAKRDWGVVNKKNRLVSVNPDGSKSIAAIETLEAKLTAAKVRIKELEKMLEPAYIYDPQNWETTFEIGSLGSLCEGLDETDEPYEIACLAALENKWAIYIEGKGWKLFDSPDEARAALSKAKE